MDPTNRLFGAGMELRNGLRKGIPPCRNKPACAAARETGTPGFRGRRSIAPPARKAWIIKHSTGSGLWRLEKPARGETYGRSTRMARPELTNGGFCPLSEICLRPWPLVGTLRLRHRLRFPFCHVGCLLSDWVTPAEFRLGSDRCRRDRSIRRGCRFRRSGRD